MTIAVTRLGRTIPATMERAMHVLEPGQTITGEAWRKALVVVDHGGIEIQTAVVATVRRRTLHDAIDHFDADERRRHRTLSNTKESLWT